MWPFRKKNILDQSDTTAEIWIGNRAFPLTCDNQLYNDNVQLIRQYVSSWLQQEIEIMQGLSVNPEVGLLNTFRKVDIKMLGWPDNVNILLNLLRDNQMSIQGQRFEDLVIRIIMNVPVEIMEVITGKFLYAVLYKTRKVVNDNTMPTKEAWENALITIPWIPLLSFVQEVMDTEQSMKRIAAKAAGNTQYVYQTTDNRFTRVGRERLQ